MTKAQVDRNREINAAIARFNDGWSKQQSRDYIKRMIDDIQSMNYASVGPTFPRAFDNGYMATTPAAVQAAKQNHNSTSQDILLARSPDSAAMLEYWDLTDTLVDGINALRLAGERYLPKFTDEQDPDYQYRLKCTKLTNIYRDTVEGLASKPFEQEVELVTDENKTVPDEIEAFEENVDGSGNNLTMFASAAFFNGVNSAIHWIFVDYPDPESNPDIRTRADEKAAGVRPYWSHILGRNVFDPRSKVINGKETLTYIRIFEPGKPDHVRIFERDPITGIVRWELREKQETWIDYGTGKTQFHTVDEGTISIGVIPLVPFITGRRDGRSWKLFPAMRDAADLQVELYQQESGLKYIKTLAAYPMLAANGIKPMMEADGKTPKKLAVGPGRVLYGGMDGAGNVGSWSYVEPGAQSMTFLAADAKETAQNLRELGRQPLTAQSGNLTVITTAVAAGKAKSAVKAWAFGLKDALENAMVMTCAWLKITPEKYDPTVNVYTEFDEFMEGKDLETLQAARAAKDISQLTYWDELKRRAVLSPEFDAETEEKRLLDELPGDGVDTNGNDDPPEIDPLTGKPMVKP